MFRLNKLRLSTPNFLSRIQRRIESFRCLNSRSESPISFRASLFDCDTSNRQSSSGSLDVKRARSNVPHSSQWHAIHNKLASTTSHRDSTQDLLRNEVYEENFYRFGAHTRKIGLKHPQPLLTGRNYAIPLDRPMLPTPTTPKIVRLKPHTSNDNSLKDISKSTTNIGEDIEFNVLKDYFETTSYTEILNDPDFKDYLSRKNYGDILDYMNANKEADGSDASSLYNDPYYLRPRRIQKAKSTGNLYDSLGYSTLIDGPATYDPRKKPHEPTIGLCHSLRRIKHMCFQKHPDQNDVSKNQQRIDKYMEIKKLCHHLLEGNQSFDGQSAKTDKSFSEKKYRRLLERYVQSKGFATVDKYVYAKFGNILDQTVCSTIADEPAIGSGYSKRYMENIPKRYHVTKQQFLEADFSKNVFHDSLYSRNKKFRQTNKVESPSNWSCDRSHDFRGESHQQMSKDDFKHKFKTIGYTLNKKSEPDQKNNTETLPAYWTRRPKADKTMTKTNKYRKHRPTNYEKQKEKEPSSIRRNKTYVIQTLT